MLTIPDSLKDADAILLFVKTPGKSYAVEVSKGCGDEWEGSGDDAYITWDAAEYVGNSLSETFFKEGDGGILTYSSDEYRNWQDVIYVALIREMLGRDLKADNSDVEIIVLGKTE